MGGSGVGVCHKYAAEKPLLVCPCRLKKKKQQKNHQTFLSSRLTDVSEPQSEPVLLPPFPYLLFVGVGRSLLFSPRASSAHIWPRRNWSLKSHDIIWSCSSVQHRLATIGTDPSSSRCTNEAVIIRPPPQECANRERSRWGFY